MAEKKNILTKVGIGVAAFAIGLVGVYALTPDKVKTIDLTGSVVPGGETHDDSYFNRFVKHLSDAADENSQEEISGLKANIDGLKLSFGNKNKDENSDVYDPANNIEINGVLLFSMESFSDFKFTLDAGVDYNGKQITIGAGYVDNTVFLALKDLRLKASHQYTIEDGGLFDRLHSLFFDATNAQGLQMSVDLDKFLSEKLGDLDFSSLLSSLSGESAPKITEEVFEKQDLVKFTIDLDAEANENLLDNQKTNIVEALIKKSTLGVQYIDLNQLRFGDFAIDGTISCSEIEDSKIVGLESDEFVRYDSTLENYGDTFVEIYSYVNWADDILNFLKTRQGGLQLTADVTLDNENELEAPTKLTSIVANVDYDISSLFDLQGKVVGGAEPSEDVTGEDQTGDITEESEKTMKDKVMEMVEKVSLCIDVSVEGQEDEEYANMGVALTNSTGFISLNEGENNEAVMKAKVTLDTVNALIDKINSVMDKNDTTDKTSSITKLFSFISDITDSDLVKGIKEGHYESVLDILDVISNDSDSITVVLNLSPIGLGNNSRITLTLDASENRGDRVVSLLAENIKLGSANLRLGLETKAFSNTRIAKVIGDSENYDELNYLPSVFDQVSNILDSKKAGFTVSGSVTKDNKKTLDIVDSWGKFDYGTKYGYGTMTLRSYKEDGSVSYNHKINLDVDNHAQEAKDRNVKFTYGPNDGIKGEFTIQTVTDIFELVSTFVKENKDEEKFSKFFEPIMDMLGVSYIGDAIKSKDYLAFAKSSVIKEINEDKVNNCIRIVMGKAILGLEEDLVINVDFKGTGENREIKGISLPGLVMGEKTIALSINIVDFDSELIGSTTPVNMSYIFMPFSDIAILLECGINTTDLNIYHLTANIYIKAILGLKANFDLDFYVQVDGVKTKVYGVIEDVPYVIPVVSNDALTDVKSEFVFEPNHDASNNDIGGYFHIVRTEKHKGLFNRSTEVYYYKSDSKNFLDSENHATNLIYYLMCDLLNFTDTIGNAVVDAATSDESTSKNDPDYEKAFTSKGFSYTENKTNHTYRWDIGLDLKSLTGVGALSDLDLTIDGALNDVNNKKYLTSLYAKTTLVSIVNLEATIKLLDADPNQTSWPSLIQGKYNTIVSILSKLSASNRNNFNNNYFNKPLKEYKINKSLIGL